MKKVLFIDRDGTLVREPKDYQLDAFEKLVFYPNMISWLSKLAKELDFELVMITNQDGLGTSVFPEKDFWPVQDFIVSTLKGESIVFDEILIDRSFAKDNTATRKPNTGMLTKYKDDAVYDLKNSFVIGDRLTDMELAKNLGCKGILIGNHKDLAIGEITVSEKEIEQFIGLETTEWKDIYHFLKLECRQASLSRIRKKRKFLFS